MRTKDENKRKAIRDATVAEVIEGGLAGASIAKIARRAGVSQGTIYLYFTNKNDLLQQVYLEIKRDIHRTMMQGQVASETSAKTIKRLWFLFFEYVVANPNDFAFAEYVTAAQVFAGHDTSEIDAMSQDISTIIERAIEDGTLVKAPVSSILAVLTAPASHLARRQVSTKVEMAADILETTFDLSWRGIAR